METSNKNNNNYLEIVDINNNLNIPKEVLFKGNKYKGEAVFVNGFNGYTSTESDGVLCALIDKSVCDNESDNLNYLTNKDGLILRSKLRRGMYLEIK